MKACILSAPGKFFVQELPIPEIKDNEVLIRVEVCGVCMSELSDFLTGKGTNVIMGHEPVGIVEKTGVSVHCIQPGDRVTGLFEKAFAEYAVAEENMLLKVPESLNEKEAILEPWSCLVSGMDRVGSLLGKSVAVIGCGYMGLGALQLARISGAAKVIAIDVRQKALQRAKKFGADECLVCDEIPAKNIVDVWERELDGRGVDVVIEASGSVEGLELAGKITRPHGILSIVGYHNCGGFRKINMELWNWKAITVINAHERRKQKQMEYMKYAMDLIKNKRLDAAGMVTNSYTLEEIETAFRDMQEKPQNYIKGYIRIS